MNNNKLKTITQVELKKFLSYKDGKFFWKKTIARRIKIGDRAGCLGKKNWYRVIRIDGKNYSEHRLVWLYHIGEFPKNQIDHINQIKYDNRIENLREVSHIENHKNQPLRKDNTSGFVGVYWYRKTKKWMAGVQVHGKSINLGYFNKIEDAVKAREKASMKYGFHKNHGSLSNY
mgnify:CR=1 FL=1